MSDLYARLVNHEVGQRVADALGLPKPHDLRRHEPGQPALDGPVLVLGGGDSGTGRYADAASSIARGLDLEVHTFLPDADDADAPDRFAGLLLDASGIAASDDLVLLWESLHRVIRRLGGSSRVVVLGHVPATVADDAAHTAQRSLEGFVRTVAKELRAGGTANLVEVAADLDADAAAAALAAPLRFLLSGRSAFVSGQRLTVGGAATETVDDVDLPHAGRVAVVTGAARGIGAAIARTLARDGATVVCVDLPAAGEQLAAVANEVGGTALQLDITGDDAGARIADHVRSRHGHLDVMVHNAGVTRDKTLAGMDRDRWTMVLGVNLTAIERIDAALLGDHADVLGPDPRVVCVSSMSGIAGNRGQANYTTSKAGIIGHVEALADDLAAAGGTINAVAPGVIETEMWARVPLATREVGRRTNSLSQGGLPVDVAEAISYLAWPDAGGINGTTLRVCGQNLLGA